MSFWKNDNYFVGATVGLFLTIISAVILILIVPVIYKMAGWYDPSIKILLLSIVPTIVMMRYYMRALKYTKSGAGALTIVFISIILYFALIADKITQFPTFVQ